MIVNSVLYVFFTVVLAMVCYVIGRYQGEKSSNCKEEKVLK